MRLFGRRRGRADVGTFEAPPPVPSASDEHLVDESRIIAYAALRMAVKNRIIVDALRDRRDLDRERLGRFARTHLEALADQEAETAHRLRLRREIDPQPRLGDTPDPLRAEKARRAHLLGLLADSLYADLADEAKIDEIVEICREAAWGEIKSSILRRAREAAPAPVDQRYALERADRIGAFVALDLAALAHERGADLG